MLSTDAARALRDFLKQESVGGILLMVTAAPALIATNSGATLIPRITGRQQP